MGLPPTTQRPPYPRPRPPQLVPEALALLTFSFMGIFMMLAMLLV